MTDTAQLDKPDFSGHPEPLRDAWEIASERGISVSQVQAEQRGDQLRHELLPRTEAKLEKQQAELAAKAAELEAEVQRQRSVAIAWNESLERLKDARQRLTNVQYHLGCYRDTVTGQRDWMRHNAGNPHDLQMHARLDTLTNSKAAIPELEQTVEAITADIAAEIERIRTYGKEHGIAENLWPKSSN